MRAWWIIAVGCAPTPPPAPPSHTVETRVVEPASPCEDVVEGPLQIAPTFDPGYLVSPQEVVGRIMQQHAAVFHACYTHRALHEPMLGGTVTLTFRVLPDGHPTAVRTRGFDSIIDRCICDRLLDIHFPSAAAGTVSFPLRFVP